MTTASPASPSAGRRHRANSWDRWAVIGLGAAGSALSYDALRQMATAVHTRNHLTYLFPIVIDGFIAYGVRALLVLRDAPLRARLYAWALFIAATAASIWANCLHAVDLNQPGTTALHLDDTTVAVLSAIAPLALAGATHLHILINRYGRNASTRPHGQGTTTKEGGPEAEDPYRPDLFRTVPAEVAYRTTAQLAPAGHQDLASVTRQPAEDAEEGRSDGTRFGTEPVTDRETEQHTEPAAQQANTAGDGPDDGSGPRPNPGGRPALASLDQLVDVISAAFPDIGSLTRDGARKAVTDAGLGAGTGRLTEAMTIVRQRAKAQQAVQD